MMNPADHAIEQLAAQINRSASIDLLREMIAIPSVNPFDEPASDSCRELEIADYYQARMDQLGMHTFRRDVVKGRPNVFGRIKGTGKGPCIMLAGHLNTVGIDGYDNPFDPKILDHKIYGRGSCDMKAGLAAYIEVARIILENDVELAGDLLIAGIADEEYSMLGSIGSINALFHQSQLQCDGRFQVLLISSTTLSRLIYQGFIKDLSR